MSNIEISQKTKNTQWIVVLITFSSVFLSDFLTLRLAHNAKPTHLGMILGFVFGLVFFLLSIQCFSKILVGSEWKTKGNIPIILDKKSATKKAILFSLIWAISASVFFWAISFKLDNQEISTLALVQSKKMIQERYGICYWVDMKTINQNHSLDQHNESFCVKEKEYSSILLGKIAVLNLRLSPLGTGVSSWHWGTIQEIKDSGVHYQETTAGIRFFTGNDKNEKLD